MEAVFSGAVQCLSEEDRELPPIHKILPILQVCVRLEFVRSVSVMVMGSGGLQGLGLFSRRVQRESSAGKRVC